MPQCGVTLWFTGLSGAGKTTICREVEAYLHKRRIKVQLLDGDIVRQQLTKDLGFCKSDRMTNVERVAFVANLLCKHGIIVLASFISPFREMREYARRTIFDFREIYVKCSIKTCIKRDVKGLYRKAMQGEIKQFTGISDPYEPPLDPDLILETDRETVEESTLKVIHYLKSQVLIS